MPDLVGRVHVRQPHPLLERAVDAEPRAGGDADAEVRRGHRQPGRDRRAAAASRGRGRRCRRSSASPAARRAGRRASRPAGGDTASSRSRTSSSISANSSAAVSCSIGGAPRSRGARAVPSRGDGRLVGADPADAQAAPHQLRHAADADHLAERAHRPGGLAVQRQLGQRLVDHHRHPRRPGERGDRPGGRRRPAAARSGCGGRRSGTPAAARAAGSPPACRRDPSRAGRRRGRAAPAPRRPPLAATPSSACG